ncbi:MAG: hypothetical protein U1F83_09540 [Verrucomicrobiota bacterium]
MSLETLMLLAIVSVAVLAGGYWIATHYFSEEARWERRRRRSNAPIASRSSRPSVKLSVRIRKKRRK